MRQRHRRSRCRILDSCLSRVRFRGHACIGAWRLRGVFLCPDERNCICYLAVGSARSLAPSDRGFRAAEPGCKVISEIGPQSSTQLHDLLTQKLKNRDPRLDVFVMDVIWPAEFASAGWTLPLDRYFTAERTDSGFFDAPIAANRYRGRCSACLCSSTPVCSTTGKIF